MYNIPMAKIKIIYDAAGETVTVYSHEPSKNQICEELGNGIVLIKNDKTGEVIGIEQLYYRPEEPHRLIIESVQ